MKVAVSFICGVIVCCLIIFGIKPILPARADITDPTTDNTTTTLTGLLPDIAKIYQDALTEPFIKAESKITDPDIAEYYHGLMQKTGLTDTTPINP